MKQHLYASIIWLGATVSSVLAENSGSLEFVARTQTPDPSGEFQITDKPMVWASTRTAVVICDMWDRHWCRGATARVAEMAPRMNEVVRTLRQRGVLIIHCPSDTMKFYEGHPGRVLAKSAPKVDTQSLLKAHAGRAPANEPPHPIDASDGGCDDDPPCVHPPYPWTRQIATIEIQDGDAITDNLEAFNLMHARGITNVVIMGVHENMCILNRPFAIKSMVTLGQNVVLVRDLTDTMYNSRRPPGVDHFTGNDLMTSHIERYWCPTITSAQLIGGRPFRFAQDTRPRIAFVVGEDEYDARRTLPAFVKHELAAVGRFVCAMVQGDSKTNLVGLEALREADLAVFYLRRCTLPASQLSLVREYLASGRPVIGLRTASHGFQNWLEFDPLVLGGNYHGHFGKPREEQPATLVKTIEAIRDHPILRDLDGTTFPSASWLYKVRPLAATATPLMMGQALGSEGDPEPVAWINVYQGARVFYTSLGHPQDFASNWFAKLLVNAIKWALENSSVD